MRIERKMKQYWLRLLYHTCMRASQTKRCKYTHNTAERFSILIIIIIRCNGLYGEFTIVWTAQFCSLVRAVFSILHHFISCLHLLFKIILSCFFFWFSLVCTVCSSSVCKCTTSTKFCSKNIHISNNSGSRKYTCFGIMHWRSSIDDSCVCVCVSFRLFSIETQNFD